MTEIKVGDEVHVQLVGTVEEVHDGWIKVRPPGKGRPVYSVLTKDAVVIRRNPDPPEIADPATIVSDGQAWHVPAASASCGDGR